MENTNRFTVVRSAINVSVPQMDRLSNYFSSCIFGDFPRAQTMGRHTVACMQEHCALRVRGHYADGFYTNGVPIDWR